MKIMTFNLRVDVPVDGPNYWPYRIESVAAMISKHDPDVLGLQEVTDKMKADLTPLFPHYEFVGHGRNADYHGEACTVMVKKETIDILHNRTFWLSSTPSVPGSMDEEEGFPRICTEVILREHGETTPFRFLNTHFAYRSERARLQNVTTLLEDYIHQAHYPTLLVGDFNAETSHVVHSNLRHQGFINGFDALHRTHIHTFHGFHGDPGEAAIDFIYGTSIWQFESIQVDNSLCQNRYPSDHYPVIATVKQK